MPPEVAQQYQDIMQRSQWQRAQLEQGGPGIRRGRVSGMGAWGRGGQGSSPHPDASPPSEYAAQLERQLQFYTEAARRLGNDGSRVSQARAGWALGGGAARGCPLTASRPPGGCKGGTLQAEPGGE